ncbi:hypothetical protein BJ546DRAFT_185830 [Cryomyces antarcticus]
MTWFGSLQLAYKYVIVFLVLLSVTLCVGVGKVLYNRKKLRDNIRKQEIEAGNRGEDRVELNTREKDEGDLFGIRAIEAGYFGGVVQSRPTSPTGSSRPSMAESSTWGGERPSLRFPPSAASSTTSLSQVRYSSSNNTENTSPPRKSLLPQIHISGLRPSPMDNRDAPVDMTLNVPPSPSIPSPGSENGSDLSKSPAFSWVASPNPSSFPPSASDRPKMDHYVPVPRLSLPDDIEQSVHDMRASVNSVQRVQSATASMSSTGSVNEPPSPGHFANTSNYPARGDSLSLFPPSRVRTPTTALDHARAHAGKPLPYSPALLPRQLTTQYQQYHQYHQRHHEDPRHLLALGVAFLLPAHPQAALRPPFPHHPSHPRTHQRRLPTHALPVLPAASTASKTARPPARSRASPSAPPSSPRRAPRVLHPTAPTQLQTPAFPPRPLPATKTPPPPPTTTHQ